LTRSLVYYNAAHERQIGPIGLRSDVVNFAPDIRVGRECLLNIHRIYLL
jgi:hypothetical protein